MQQELKLLLMELGLLEILGMVWIKEWLLCHHITQNLMPASLIQEAVNMEVGIKDGTIHPFKVQSIIKLENLL